MASKTASKVQECSREHYENLGRVCRRCCIKCIAADSRSKNHGRNLTADVISMYSKHWDPNIVFDFQEQMRYPRAICDKCRTQLKRFDNPKSFSKQFRFTKWPRNGKICTPDNCPVCYEAARHIGQVSY